MKEKIKNSVVLITGGTGTFGEAFLEYILQFEPKQVRIFSRDTKKQYKLQQKYSQYNNIKYCIGDIQNAKSVNKVMSGVDYVFHAAAIKQIPTCEHNPVEAFKVNVLGSIYVLEAAIQNKVKKVICISTDKAASPASVMGTTKLCMEKIAQSMAKKQSSTAICVVRFCNLIYSSGSVVPLFISQIQNNLPLTVTDPDMTRYFISMTQAIQLVERAFLFGDSGEIYIKNGKICSIKDLAQAVISLMNKPFHPIKIVGPRKGEKKHEYLCTKEELLYSRLENDYLIISDRVGALQNIKTEFLTIEEIKSMLVESIKDGL